MKQLIPVQGTSPNVFAVQPARLASAALAALGLLGAAGQADGMIPQPPATNRITLSWTAPYKGDTNIRYKVYGSQDISSPVAGWPLVTNVAWPATSVPIVSPNNSGFFVVTISNYWGETPISSAQPAPSKKNVTLAWDYENTTDAGLGFKLYHTTDETMPITAWPVLTNVPGTARSLTLALYPGTHIFALTATNVLGESDFSNTASTPPAPKQPGNIKLQK